MHHDHLVHIFLRKIRYSLKEDALRSTSQISTAVGSFNGRLPLDFIVGLVHASSQLFSTRRIKTRVRAIEDVGHSPGLARVHRGHRASSGPNHCLDATGYF